MKLEVMEYLPNIPVKTAPLLFIHGAYHGAWCWKEHFLPYFSTRGFPSYALSYRGHGASDGRKELNSFSLEDYTEDVLQTMELLPDKPVLVGHSLGGAVAQKILYSYPDKLKAVVLLASVSPNGMLQDFLRLYISNIRDVVRMHLFNDSRTKVNFIVNHFFPRDLPAGKRDNYVKLLQPESSRVRRDYLRKIITGLPKSRVPLLVIGSENDPVISQKTTAGIGRYYGVEPVIFPDISHDMMLDPRWKTVACRIFSFLNDLHLTKEREKP